MSDKCEWKNDVFYPCAGADGEYAMDKDGDVTMGDVTYLSYPGYIFKYCPFCGADIRNPEPEVIIKKSGGTWVVKHRYVDYLVTDRKITGLGDNWTTDGMDAFVKRSCNPISEITIDDNLALLRPMGVFSYEVEHCIWKEETPRILIYAKYDGDSYEFFDDNGRPYVVCRLATVSDL